MKDNQGSYPKANEEDWRYLEALMHSFGNFLSIIPYGHRDKAWWDKFYEFDSLLKEYMKKVQNSPTTASEEK